MPTLTRWMIRTSLAWLVVGLTLQLVSPFASSLSPPWVLPGLRAFEVHVLTVGWLTQLIFGVVYWMFPRPVSGNPRSPLGWATFLGLNLGLLLRATAEGLAPPGGAPFAGWAMPLSASLQWLAAVAFALNTWPRVRER